MKVSPVVTLYHKIRNAFKSVLGDEFMELEKREAVSVSRIFNAIYTELEKIDYWVWIHDLYLDDGSMFVIFSSESKIYRASVELDGEEVEVSEWLELDLNATRTRTRVIRQADGRTRWISISSTAVLNRSGEIDSMALFDSFVEHAERTGEYPYRTFYHQNEEMKMGQADYLARDGYCYITSGLYDEDCPLADAEIAAREREPEYWGESIGFWSTSEPEILKVTDDVGIPVYQTGVNIEISTLPEERAAAWFIHVLNKEVLRMKPDVKEALLRLTDNDEALADEFGVVVDSVNQDIDDRELIARETEEVDPSIEPEEETEEEVEEEETPEPEAELETSELDVEIDEEVMVEIAGVFAESKPFKDLLAIVENSTESIKELVTRIDAMDKDLGRTVGQVNKRLDVIERDEDEKQRVWEEDLPKDRTMRIGYRPRDDHKEDNEEEMTLAEIAAESIATLEA